jgi:aspartyl-tRNA(Asn)/glutamyl-tRNA(Gln) amidotransferase subunit B
MGWDTVIGLEVHVQLRTLSKMFCGCSTAFGDPPNTNVCPVCLGLPGALPVPNRAAICLGVRTALALDCTIQNVSIFERKSYFYPDLPKGYQISQFQRPLATSGGLAINSETGSRRIGLSRLHLEEDAGKSLHDRVPNNTAVDFNRSGVPLVEIVSEPELREPEEARAYLSSLKQVLRYLDVSGCNMEEGSLRVDANLSVRRPGDVLGVKQELKNLNSFAAVVRGLTLLRERQIECLERRESVELQTFTFDGNGLRATRTKEESHDYRYFPDPDLPPLVLDASGIDVETERASLPELPWDRRARFEETLGLPAYAAEVITSAAKLADYFEAVVRWYADAKTVANWILDAVMADRNTHGGEFRVHPKRLAELLAMIGDGRLSKRAGKDVFAVLAEKDEEPEHVAERMGLLQVSDDAQLKVWVDRVLDSYPQHVVRYHAGEVKLLDYFMGRAMEESEGRANPTRLRTVLQRCLEELST